jgi:DNA-binding CsgD family transcriptional regulator
MERLTKKELRALLEFIKECYPICDIETFAQRVVSRLSKIVPTEISFNGVNPRKERNACPTYPLHAPTSSENKILEQCVREHPVVIHHGKTRDNLHGQLHGLRLHNKFYPRLGVKYRIAPRLIRQFALNRKSKDFAGRDQLLLKLLRPHVFQAYRNAETVTHMQQKLTLVDRALYRLNVGLIFLTPDGKIRLATTWAMQRVTSYLGLQPLRKTRLPDPLLKWVKQQEVAPSGKDDVLLRQSPLVLEREGKRLVIRLVSDLDQSLLLLEEHPTTMPPQSLVPFGLSPREAQVLDWVAQGKTNKEIGVILELSPRTVQKHLEHIYRKIYVESRTAAAAKAYEIALIASKQTGIFFLVVISSLMN